MRDRLGVLVLGLAATAPLPAQGVIANRTTALAFASGVYDVRGLWLNPAALGGFPIASVMADLTMARPFEDDSRMSQWTLAMSSRGLGLGYQHDELESGGVRDSYRAGYARAGARTAFGGAVTLYRGNGHDLGGDVGVIHSFASAFRASAAVTNIGEPVLADSLAVPLTLASDVTWLLSAGRIALSAAGAVTPDSLQSWAAGVAAWLPTRLPLALLVRLDAPREFELARLTFGLTVGRQDAIQFGLTAPRSLQSVEYVSLTGSSTRALGR